MAHSTDGWLNYISDNSNNYSVKGNDAEATFNGQTLAPFPTSACWPFGRPGLRYVRGKDTSGAKPYYGSMIVMDPTVFNGLTIGTSGFTDSKGNNYTVISKFGERQSERYEI